VSCTGLRDKRLPMLTGTAQALLTSQGAAERKTGDRFPVRRCVVTVGQHGPSLVKDGSFFGDSRRVLKIIFISGLLKRLII